MIFVSNELFIPGGLADDYQGLHVYFLQASRV